MWPFLINYWKETLILLLFAIIFVLWYRDHASLVRAMEITDRSHQEEMLVIQDSLRREIEEKNILTQKYIQNIEKIKSDFEDTKRELDSLKLGRKEQIIADRTENPKEVAKLIEDAFGFTYVE
tara:strand:+ start:439 stop:807 length:369 start_codon:yes stop_codon:yes gene_type:complete